MCGNKFSNRNQENNFSEKPFEYRMAIVKRYLHIIHTHFNKSIVCINKLFAMRLLAINDVLSTTKNRYPRIDGAIFWSHPVDLLLA